MKILASYRDKPRPLPTILSFNTEAFVSRNSDISPCEADQRKSRPIHLGAHLLFVECMVIVESGRRVWGNESVLFTFLFCYSCNFVTGTGERKLWLHTGKPRNRNRPGGITALRYTVLVLRATRPVVSAVLHSRREQHLQLRHSIACITTFTTSVSLNRVQHLLQQW